jgi:phosphoribosylformimino-5-aminoimidazole carboxamide ribotide isomerase
MRFRPCIDIHEGKVKQIVGSTLSDNPQQGPVTNFETDLPPSHYARLYKKDNLTGGHVIMLGKGNESAAVEALMSFQGGLQVGGGINTENAAWYLDRGASHVIITSYVFSGSIVHWDNLELLKSTFGKNRLVLDLSCKKRDGKYFVVTDRWQKFTDVELNDKNFNKLAAYCDEFLIHAADVEGKRGGIDEELLELLAANVSIPSTYAGGIRSIDDLELVKVLGKNRIDATIGSALDIFGGDLSFLEVVKWHKSAGSK